MTAKQESLILSLLGTDPDGFNSIELQKLMFVFSRTEEAVPSYEFIPFKKGCFSPTLANDIRKLAERGLVAGSSDGNGHSRWMLTERGEYTVVAHRAVSARFASFLRRYPLRGLDLVADVYRRFPYWATRSEIADIVLKGDEAALETIARARPTRETPLASIGYEGRSFEDYLNALIANGTTTLCDVRRNPVSRKYGFSKSSLVNACSGMGIAYVHIPELGIPSYERQDLECQADYDALFRRYEENVLPAAGDFVAAIARRVSDGERVAVTCFEKNPAQCHRTRVLGAVTRMTGVVPEHI